MHRPVERVVPADLLDQLRIGALTEHGPGRIAQADRGEREDEQADAEQDRQQRQHALGRGLQEVAEHRYSILTFLSGARNSGAVESGERSRPFTAGRIRARLA